MAATLEEPKTETPEPVAPAPPGGAAPVAAAAHGPACVTCAAPMADGQDWCLECGAAQPGRLGSRPGWRAALTVLGLTGVLAMGAAAAAYAALTSEAQREASAPAPPAAAPQIAQPPAQPAPPAEDSTPSVAAPDSDPLPEVSATADEPADPPAPVAESPTASSGAGPSGGATGAGASGGGDGGGGAREPSGPSPLDLTGDAASTYDPLERGDGEVGDPADALDGDADTAWQAPVGSDGDVRIGLALSLEQARRLSRIVVKADTPGFSLQVYGTRSSALPADVTDAAWERLGSRGDVGTSAEVGIGGRYRHVLVWITAQPADTIVRLPEVQLFG